MDRGRANWLQVSRACIAHENATLERLVDTQLGALKEALHGAMARARSGIGNDPSSAAVHAELGLIVRLARASTKLVCALACLKPIRHTLTVTHIGPDGRILKKRTRTWMQERTVPLPRLKSLPAQGRRGKEEGGGGTRDIMMAGKVDTFCHQVFSP